MTNTWFRGAVVRLPLARYAPLAGWRPRPSTHPGTTKRGEA